MLILLPPSEGKTRPAQGDPVDVPALSHPVLTRPRRAVLRALEAVGRHPEGARLLGVPPGLSAEVERNRRLRREPAAPAREVYSGVLYSAARLGELSAAQTERAESSVRIVSALWGVVSPADLIPAYRLSMSVDLPGVGPLARFWREPLARALGDRSGLVVDCRSAAYATAWRPPAGADWVTVRVVQEQEGRRTVVSHHAKHARGLLTRHLLTRDAPAPESADALREVAAEMPGSELREAVLHRGGRGPAVLELLVRGTAQGQQLPRPVAGQP